MVLTATQAEEILKAPAHKKEIESVKKQESQLRVFTEELDKSELGTEYYHTQLKEQISTRTPQKAARVWDFARYPLPVTQICDSILTDFFKVFDGKNRNFNIDGDRELKSLKDWVSAVNLEKWIEETARAVFKNKPCSFVVVDADEAGNPYLINIDTERLIDAQFVSRKGNLEYIAFLHSEIVVGEKTKLRYAVYDDASYHIFDKDDAGNYLHQKSTPHAIGYTPAVAFISQPANDKNFFKRRVAFSSALSKLEDWTIFDIFRNFVDHYAPFPVTEAPEKECPNPDCINGYTTTETVKADDIDNPIREFHKCKICESNAGQYIGPGTHIGITVARTKEENDGSGVFKIISFETEQLKYVPEKLDDLELEIRYKTIGVNEMKSTNEAMNELQVKGSFTSMETVLVRTKEELDTVYKWVVQTVARYMYKNVNVTVDANFGTEFYLLTEEELQLRYDTAKKAGLREEQMMIYLQIIDTKYKGNPNKVKRQKMLLELDPLPLYDLNEAILLKDKGVIDLALLSYKINFINFVARFESENGQITQFGQALPPERVIEIIRETLDAYNVELLAKMKPEPAEEEKPATV